MKKRETLYEITPIGDWQRVAAIDATTGKEVVVQVAKKTPRPTALKIAYKALQKKLFPEDSKELDIKIPPQSDGIDIIS